MGKLGGALADGHFSNVLGSQSGPCVCPRGEGILMEAVSLLIKSCSCTVCFFFCFACFVLDRYTDDPKTFPQSIEEEDVQRRMFYANESIKYKVAT